MTGSSKGKNKTTLFRLSQGGYNVCGSAFKALCRVQKVRSAAAETFSPYEEESFPSNGVGVYVLGRSCVCVRARARVVRADL